MDKLILDPTCGSRMIWFNHENPYCIYTDRREMESTEIWKSKDGKKSRMLEIKPDVICDFTDLPFEDNTFYHIVFDPPHLTQLGETSWMCAKYDKLRDGWQKNIHDGFWECMRVLKPYGTLIFKWSEINVKVSELLKVIGAEPLYGNRSGKHMTTIWMAFMKIPEEVKDNG